MNKLAHFFTLAASALFVQCSPLLAVPPPTRAVTIDPAGNLQGTSLNAPSGFTLTVKAGASLDLTAGTLLPPSGFSLNKAWQVKTGSFTAVAGANYIFPDAATATLPASANIGDVIQFADNGVFSGWALDGVTIARNGNTINNVAADFSDRTTGDHLLCVYTGSSNWMIYRGSAGALLVGNNLSDLSDVSAAWSNLGLDTMAAQSASAVNITGGTITGTNIDGVITGTAQLQLTAGSNSINKFYSGATGDFVYTAWGRTGDEIEFGVAAGPGQFFSNVITGDCLLKSVSGRLLIGSDLLGGNCQLVLDGSGSLQIMSMSSAPSTPVGGGLLYSASDGTMHAMDTSGNDAVISPHALDAPPALYEIGPGADEMHRITNPFLGTITWHAETRMHHLLELQITANLDPANSAAAWNEVQNVRVPNGKMICTQVESYADYQTRTGVNLWPGSTPDAKAAFAAMTPSARWIAVQAKAVADSTANRTAWSTAHAAAVASGQSFTATEPPLYVAIPPPAWCTP